MVDVEPITFDKLADKSYLARFCKLPELQREQMIVEFKKGNRDVKRKVIDKVIDEYEKEFCPKPQASCGCCGEEEALESVIATKMLKLYRLITIKETSEIMKFENGGWRAFPKLEVTSIAQKLGKRDDVDNKIVDEVYGKLLRENLVSMTDTERRPDLFMDGSGKVFSSITRRFEDVSNRKDVLVLHKIPALFDPDAEVPQEFLDFVELVIPDADERAALQEHIGSGLFRLMLYDKAIPILGSTRNGKTTLFEIIMEVYGKNNVSSVSLQDTASRFRLFNMLRKLLNLMDELTVKTVSDSSGFKMVNGGGQQMVECKHKQPFEASFYAKSIYGCNALPPAPDKNDMGFYSKWLPITAPNTFLLPDQIGPDGLQEGEYHANPNLVKELTLTPDKLSGILNWCLDGLERLNRQGGYSLKLTLAECKARYDALADSSSLINKVIDEIFIRTNNPSDMVYKMDLFEAYKGECIGKKIPVPTINQFNKDLSKLGYDPKFRSRALSEKFSLFTNPTENPQALRGLALKFN